MYIYLGNNAGLRRVHARHSSTPDLSDHGPYVYHAAAGRSEYSETGCKVLLRNVRHVLPTEKPHNEAGWAQVAAYEESVMKLIFVHVNPIFLYEISTHSNPGRAASNSRQHFLIVRCFSNASIVKHRYTVPWKGTWKIAFVLLLIHGTDCRTETGEGTGIRLDVFESVSQLQMVYALKGRWKKDWVK